MDKLWGKLITCVTLLDRDLRGREACTNSFNVEFVFVAAVTVLPICCTAKIKGTCGNTHRWQRFMKYAVELDTCTMKHKILIKIDLVIQKLMEYIESMT
jgi:hypothetical protein